MADYDGSVPIDRPTLIYDQIRTGAPVRAQTWADMAALAHWVAGRGTMLVPQHRTLVALADGDSATWRYMVRPRGRALARVWVFEIRGDGGLPGLCYMQPQTLPSPVQGPFSVQPPTLGTRLSPIVIVEGAGSGTALTRTDADTEITCTIECTLGRVLVTSCAVWELPRTALEQDATDLAIARDGFFPRRAIQSGVDYQSVEGLMDLARSVSGLDAPAARSRSGLISRWGSMLEVTVSSATSLHSADYRLLPSRRAAGDTTRSVDCYVYAGVPVGDGPGATGEWRVVTGSGGAAAWQSVTGLGSWQGPLSVDVLCEDSNAADGLPSGAADTLRFEGRTGTGDLRVWGWTVLE